MTLNSHTRTALERIRAGLCQLAQEHPDADAFLRRLADEARPMLAQAQNDDQRHAILAELALIACEAGIPGERARRALLRDDPRAG